MLVVIAIIALLVAMLATVLSASRRAALKLKCISQMQAVAFDFRLFADDLMAGSRGDSDQFGPGRFSIDDFQDKTYAVDEFWSIAQAPRVRMEPSEEVMICPAGPKLLYRRPHRTTFELAVWPPSNVSLAFNRRLWRDGITPGITTVTSRILSHPNVPLLIDVDGEAADAAGRLPYYIAPPVERDDEYRDGEFWFPSFRHGRRLNVAFVGGHVASSAKPLEEPGWRWDYIPER